MEMHTSNVFQHVSFQHFIGVSRPWMALNGVGKYELINCFNSLFNGINQLIRKIRENPGLESGGSGASFLLLILTEDRSNISVEVFCFILD